MLGWGGCHKDDKQDNNVTNVFQSHKNPDLLHNLVNVIFPLRPDAFTRHLTVSRWIYGQVHRGKGSTPQALGSNDVIANILPDTG